MYLFLVPFLRLLYVNSCDRHDCRDYNFRFRACRWTVFGFPSTHRVCVWETSAKNRLDFKKSILTKDTWWNGSCRVLESIYTRSRPQPHRQSFHYFAADIGLRREKRPEARQDWTGTSRAGLRHKEETNSVRQHLCIKKRYLQRWRIQ